MANLGERLKELRREKKLTMKQLADILHVTEMAISHWENNKRVPNIQIIIKLAKFFNVSVGYLVGSEN